MFDLSIEEIKDTIAALEGYQFFLKHVSKSKVKSAKIRKRASDDIIIIGNLIDKYKKIEKENY